MTMRVGQCRHGSRRASIGVRGASATLWTAGRTGSVTRIGLTRAAALALALAAGPGAARAQDGKPDAVFVPTFVDPGHHVDKPDLGPNRTIRVLTTDDYPPFNFAAPDGSLAGYTVDLVRAVCEELKVACSIQARPWDGLVAALQSGAGDAVAASLAITAKTRAAVDFSTPTMRTPARFATRPGLTLAIVLPETLGALKVGVQAGTAHAAYLAAFFPAAAVKPFTDPQSLHAALKGGQVDLLFADGIATALWLNGTEAAGCCAFAGGPFTAPRYFGEGSAIAVRKGDAALKDAFDYALARLAARGVMADLYLKAFPIGPY